MRAVDSHTSMTVPSEPVRAFTARLLEGQGFDVRQAEDGVHALEITRELPVPPALLVTDIMMPRMNGSELANHFAQLFPETPVMFMSGYMDEATVRRNFQDRDAIVLQKPFAPEALIRQVKALVRATLPGRPGIGKQLRASEVGPWRRPCWFTYSKLFTVSLAT